MIITEWTDKIFAPGEILFGNRSRSVLGERLRALLRGGKIPGGLHTGGCFWLWLSDAKIWVMDAVSLRFATSDDQGTDFSYILDDCFCTNIILARGNECFG